MSRSPEQSTTSTRFLGGLTGACMGLALGGAIDGVWKLAMMIDHDNGEFFARTYPIPIALLFVAGGIWGFVNTKYKR